MIYYKEHLKMINFDMKNKICGCQGKLGRIKIWSTGGWLYKMAKWWISIVMEKFNFSILIIMALWYYNFPPTNKWEISINWIDYTNIDIFLVIVCYHFAKCFNFGETG